MGCQANRELYLQVIKKKNRESSTEAKKVSSFSSSLRTRTLWMGRRRISSMPAGVSVGGRRTEPTEPFLQSPSSPPVRINRRSLETAASQDRHPARPSPTTSALPPDTDCRYRRENIRVVPELASQQSKRIAKVALDHYNRKKKIKFELLDVRPVNFVPTKWRPYIHINFFARSSKEGSQEQLFFAELYLCGKRRTPSGYSVIFCEPLVHDSATPGLVDMDKPAGNSPVRKNLNFTYCYACDHNMLHPKGSNYVGGHCNVPGIYRGVAML